MELGKVHFEYCDNICHIRMECFDKITVAIKEVYIGNLFSYFKVLVEV